ncbi:MAG: protein kinase domain-containing protein [Ignavibacteria bacterium]
MNNNLENIEQDLNVIPLKWNIGDVIADLYKVTGILGEGGMGIVYKVRHKEWDVDLAVKSIRPEILSKTGLDSFIKEAEAWVNLGLHPNIVSCYYVRQLGEVPRIFMEYIDGGCIEELIQSGELYDSSNDDVLEKILDIAIQSAWGLKFAHDQGFVHQDVKPLNLLMSSEGTVKVTDFGIAKAKMKLGEKYIPPKKGTIFVPSGALSPQYCSPEQKEGKPLSRKTDIWSWAVSVLEMFTGGVHWVSGAIAETVLEQHLKNGSIKNNVPNIPDQLADLLQQCFKYNPKNRPNDFEEISNRLIEIYNDITQWNYKRKAPKSVDLIADSLNNKAVSFLDLKNNNKAEECWIEALKIDPQHLQSTYNYGYYRWQRADITDEELLKKITSLESLYKINSDYWECLGWIHYERGDLEAIESIQKSSYKIENKKFLNALENPERPIICEIRKLGKPIDYVLFDRNISFIIDKYIVSTDESNTIYFWDIETGNKLKTFKGHKDFISDLCISKDEKYLLSSSSNVWFENFEERGGNLDNSIRLWDIELEQEIRRFNGNDSMILSAKFSLNGEFIIAHGEDEVVRFWDVKTGNEISNFSLSSPYENQNIIMLDGNIIYITWGLNLDESIIQYWNYKSGNTNSLKSKIKYFYQYHFTKDGQLILSLSEDNIFQLWEVKTGKIIYEINHGKLVWYYTLTPDGKYVFISDKDSISIRETETGKEVKKYKSYSNNVSSANFSFDGRFVFMKTINHKSGFIKTYRIREFITGKQIRSFEASKQIIAFSSSCMFVLVNKVNKTASLWEFRYPNNEKSNNYPLISKVLQTAEIGQLQKEIIGAINKVKKLIGLKKYKPAYDILKNIPVESGYSKNLELLSLKQQLYLITGQEKRTLKNVWQKEIIHTDNLFVDYIKLNSDFMTVSTVGDEIILWEIDTGREVMRYDEYNNLGAIMDISSDGRFAISLEKGNHSLHLWDVETGDYIRALTGHEYSIICASFSPNGKNVVSGSHDNTIRIWEAETGKETIRFKIQNGSITCVNYSPDSKYVLFGIEISYSDRDEEYTYLLDTATVKISKCIEGTSFIFSNDCKYILGCKCTTIELRDSYSLNLIRQFKGHTSFINSISFSPDGKFILSGSTDNTIRIWDLNTGQEIYKIEDHCSPINQVLFSCDGRYVLSNNSDNTFCIYELDWDWEITDPVDWDEKVRPYLEIFLELHNSNGSNEKSRIRKPNWSEDDFNIFYYDLMNRGFGYIKYKGIRNELEKMTRYWNEY